LLLIKSATDIVEDNRFLSQDKRLSQRIGSLERKPDHEGTIMTILLSHSASFSEVSSIKIVFVAFGLKSSKRVCKGGF
jgi:hypothetical protein